MRFIPSRLYSITAPLALLPIMDFSFSQIGSFIRGPEVKALMSEALTQILAGAADAVILMVIQSVFGVSLAL